MKKKWIISILVLVAFGIVYFVFAMQSGACDTAEPKSVMGKIKLCYNNNWEDYSYVEEINIAEQRGVQVGVQSFQQQLFELATTCKQIPLTMSNQTINLIAIECLKTVGQE